MIVYFGRDAQGFFADNESGERTYLPEDIWREFIKAGEHVGADTTGVNTGRSVKFSITETLTLQKFEGDQLIETVET